MVATLNSKQQVLDVNLSRIDDLAVRDALETILRHLNDQAAKGISTDGTVKANSFELANQYASLSQQGALHSKTLETEGGGKFKVWTQYDTVPAADTLAVRVNGRILGVCGWTQVDASSTRYESMSEQSSGNKNFFLGDAANRYDTIIIENGHPTEDNKFNLVVFYQEITGS